MHPVVLLAVALACCSCVFDNPGAENPSPVAAESFRDIPWPSDFHLVTEGRESTKYENGEFKQGLLKYEGVGRSGDLAAFYQNQMPVAGWQQEATPADRSTLADAESLLPSDLGDRRDLFFSKGRYLAQVVVGETGPGALIVVAVKTK
ncbi:MAG: hypothetical protein U1E76_02050 [Planctomycetota bacterium]